MTGWSIPRAAAAVALVALAAVPALAQDDDPPPAQSGQGYGQSSNDGGGFASRDAAPPDSPSASPPANEDNDEGTWRSTPPPSGDAPTDDDSLDANPQQAPGTINSFTQPDPTPGFQATTGIENRNQAVSSCLAAVRDRVRGGAGASRVDGIRGEWMVSGALADGRAFYCSIHAGAIADIELGS